MGRELKISESKPVKSIVKDLETPRNISIRINVGGNASGTVDFRQSTQIVTGFLKKSFDSFPRATFDSIRIAQCGTFLKGSRQIRKRGTQRLRVAEHPRFQFLHGDPVRHPSALAGNRKSAQSRLT